MYFNEEHKAWVLEYIPWKILEARRQQGLDDYVSTVIKDFLADEIREQILESMPLREQLGSHKIFLKYMKTVRNYMLFGGIIPFTHLTVWKINNIIMARCIESGIKVGGIVRYVKSSSESEMILEFVRAELHSNRFSNKIIKSINDINTTIDIIMKPDLNSDMENTLRKQILASYRGYGQNESLFKDFPVVTKWNWESIEKDDINHIRYINYSYWNEISSGTSSPHIAATNIKKGIISCGVPNDGFFAAVEALKKGSSFSPMILLKDYNETICIVLEGHVRLTAYALSDYHMKGILCLVGYCSKEDLVMWNGG